VAAILTFDGGMVVNYQGTWQGNWAVSHFEWRTDCTVGVITQRDQFGDLSYARRDDPQLTPVPLPPHELWITETSGLLAAFLDTVLDRAPLQCSGRDHLLSLAMLQACIVSCQQQRAVAIHEVLPSWLLPG
jgi:predicted dehydrogenase